MAKMKGNYLCEWGKEEENMILTEGTAYWKVQGQENVLETKKKVCYN